MGLRYKVRALLAGSKVTRKDRRSHGRVRRAIRGSRHPQLDGSFATANESGKARIAILDRADVNTEQSRVYDAAKQSTGIVGGPYSYIRLPKLFEACQNLRASLSSGPLSQREQQIVNLIVARHWNARYPWFAQVRRSLAIGIEQAVIDAINAYGESQLGRRARAHLLGRGARTARKKGLSDETYTAAEKTMGLESPVALVASIGSFSMTCMTANTFGIDAPAENPTPLAN